jgi:hypothetical protein
MPASRRQFSEGLAALRARRDVFFDRHFFFGSNGIVQVVRQLGLYGFVFH